MCWRAGLPFRLLCQDLTSWKSNRNLMELQNRNANSYTWNKIIPWKKYFLGGSSDKRTQSPGETQAECMVHLCNIESLPPMESMSKSTASSCERELICLTLRRPHLECFLQCRVLQHKRDTDIDRLEQT